MAIFSSLSRQQKEAVGLLQIGTFLEYFDLMLYVHMAVLLNELFFPKTDPHTASLLAAFSFCSIWVLRPFGALIFGYIGDSMGRKPTVIITTMMMAASCILIASTPTYAEIGITAAWLIILCRFLQGITSMCEIIGGEVYLTEIIQKPLRNTVVASLRIVDDLGSMVALIVASIVTLNGMNWRTGFWIGASIAVIGSIGRIRLRESQDFVKAKEKVTIKNSKETKLNLLTCLAYFFIQTGTPFFFTFAYIFCGNLLQNKFNYTSEQVINHNLLVSIAPLTASFLYTLASKYWSPFIILRLKIFFNFVVCVVTPFQLFLVKTPQDLLYLQCAVMFFCLSGIPGQAIFMSFLPILKRMRLASFLYAIARAFIYAISSFGIIYLIKYFGYYGLWVISLPVCFSFLWGVNYFQKLENQKQHEVHTTPHQLSIKPDELKAAG